MEEIKNILDSLNSALSELQRKIAETDESKEENRIKEIALSELKVELDKKEVNLNTREGKIAEIESIVEFAETAKAKMREAKALIENAEKRQEVLEKGLKQLADDKVKLEKEHEDKNKALQKQAEALKAERKEFEDKVRAYKAMAAAVK